MRILQVFHDNLKVQTTSSNKNNINISSWIFNFLFLDSSIEGGSSFRSENYQLEKNIICHIKHWTSKSKNIGLFLRIDLILKVEFSNITNRLF